jgi:hypothetical protein
MAHALRVVYAEDNFLVRQGTAALLVVGLLHASSDAAGAAFGSGWQQMLASVPLALLLLAYRAVRRRSTVEPVAVPV